MSARALQIVEGKAAVNLGKEGGLGWISEGWAAGWGGWRKKILEGGWRDRFGMS